MLKPVCDIKTSRLTLATLRPFHMERFIAITSNWEVARMTADIPYPMTLRAAQLWFQNKQNDIRFSIELAGQMIGTVGYFLSDTNAPETTRGELGFFLAPECWGHGYASEAGWAVISYGFDTGNLTQFTSSHFTDNPGSARVLHKLGFEPTGNFCVHCDARQKSIDAISYQLLRSRQPNRQDCLTSIQTLAAVTVPSHNNGSILKQPLREAL